MTVSGAGGHTRAGGIGKAPSLLPSGDGGVQAGQQSPPGPFQQGLQMTSKTLAVTNGKGRLVGGPDYRAGSAMQAPSLWQGNEQVAPGPLAAPLAQHRAPAASAAPLVRSRVHPFICI